MSSKTFTFPQIHWASWLCWSFFSHNLSTVLKTVKTRDFGVGIFSHIFCGNTVFFAVVQMHQKKTRQLFVWDLGWCFLWNRPSTLFLEINISIRYIHGQNLSSLRYKTRRGGNEEVSVTLETARSCLQKLWAKWLGLCQQACWNTNADKLWWNGSNLLYNIL